MLSKMEVAFHSFVLPETLLHTYVHTYHIEARVTYIHTHINTHEKRFPTAVVTFQSIDKLQQIDLSPWLKSKHTTVKQR